ncbi:hypothetical protein [Vulgatibacter incomptus]|uniref:hypothetical protein n=1 Tax=Vulgatibacter incomptus TaxID=1391653 RepID=UPI000682850C|nr:hypothetical protein [Vulgatibacter incomptus]
MADFVYIDVRCSKCKSEFLGYGKTLLTKDEIFDGDSMDTRVAWAKARFVRNMPGCASHPLQVWPTTESDEFFDLALSLALNCPGAFPPSDED